MSWTSSNISADKQNEKSYIYISLGNMNYTENCIVGYKKVIVYTMVAFFVSYLTCTVFARFFIKLYQSFI